ncbi:MAG: helix-turn-helix domain-containing protein [Actinobacteria bacterium]|jgi:transcriptional regulator with XRE-family HTH domain|nr:helix-turn-helix domain-containing protein [Actinomycetota bacterium]
MNLKEVLALNLRRARHAKKLTQEELADLSGLSSRYVGAIERADVSATVTALEQIATALGIEATELLKRSSRAR